MTKDPSKQFRDPEEEKRLEAEGQLSDAERDLRTIFIWQLAQKVTERDVYELFKRAGKPRDVRLIVDKRSNRHKGAGYVEFYYKDAVHAAVALSGSLICGFPVAAKPSEAEKNIAAELAAKEAAAAQGALGSSNLEEQMMQDDGSLMISADQAGQSGFTKLYVGSIHFSVSEDDLRAIFSPFGEIMSLSLHRETETGYSKGFGFVQYVSHEAARKALAQLNGLELAGRALKVGLASAEAGRAGTSTDGPTNLSSGNSWYPAASTSLGDPSGIGELDEGRDGGLSLSATQRALLMQRLSRGAMIAPKAAQPTVTVHAPSHAPDTAVPTLPGYNPPLSTTSATSRCLMLKNLFDPQKEKSPDFDVDIAEDVREECVEKYGPVTHIHVDKNSAGLVYAKFDDLTSSLKAQSALNGRWFAGLQIVAEFVAENAYYQRFPSAQN